MAEIEKRNVELAATIVAAYVSNNPVPAGTLPDVIRNVHATIIDLSNGNDRLPENPAVAIKDSIKPDYIVCLEDGKHLKMLKRYLRTNFDMTPEAYRAKWKLPTNYPMVAPNYAKLRSDHAKKIGLGQK